MPRAILVPRRDGWRHRPRRRQAMFVGGIDDGVDIERGDVAFDDLDALGHDPIGDASGVPIKSCYSAGGGLAALAEAEDGLTERIQAMIFHMSSSVLTISPMAGIGPTTFSEPLRA